jgi:ketosteroid isomerase-like protein
MSRGNVELVRRSWDAFDRAMRGGDLDSYLREFVSSDFEYTPMEEGEVIRGHHGFVQYMARWAEVWEELRWEVEELIDAGEQVVSVARMSGRARETGMELEMRYFTVSTVHEDKMVRAVEYLDRDEALEAVGLRESPGGRGNPR